jgi:hypothetical protein
METLSLCGPVNDRFCTRLPPGTHHQRTVILSKPGVFHPVGALHSALLGLNLGCDTGQVPAAWIAVCSVHERLPGRGKRVGHVVGRDGHSKRDADMGQAPPGLRVDPRLNDRTACMHSQGTSKPPLVGPQPRHPPRRVMLSRTAHRPRGRLAIMKAVFPAGANTHTTWVNASLAHPVLPPGLRRASVNPGPDRDRH